MFRRQSENTKKSRANTIWIVVSILLLSLTVGGVSAYLSMSSGSVSNTFIEADSPTVSVDGTTVTIDSNGYAVYLRVAVDADWVNGNVIMPGEPAVQFTVGTNGWGKHGSFYYYTSPIMGSNVSVPLPVSADASNDGYSLKINVAAQIIQAVGTVDNTTTTAVMDAWGVNFPEATVNTGN